MYFFKNFFNLSGSQIVPKLKKTCLTIFFTSSLNQGTGQLSARVYVHVCPNLVCSCVINHAKREICIYYFSFFFPSNASFFLSGCIIHTWSTVLPEERSKCTMLAPLPLPPRHFIFLKLSYILFLYLLYYILPQDFCEFSIYIIVVTDMKQL